GRRIPRHCSGDRRSQSPARRRARRVGLRDDLAGRARGECRRPEADGGRSASRRDHCCRGVGPRGATDSAHGVERGTGDMILLAFFAQTLRIAIPYLFAASGGVMSERSGLIALGLEGYMLGGAFCGALASYYSGSPWVGLLGAAAGGMAFVLLYAVTAIRFRADQVVVGIAINLLVIGATRFFLRLAFHSSANSPRISGFGSEQAGTGVMSLVGNPLIALGILAVAFVAWLLYRTPFGLRVRAVGEHPAAATSVGIRVARVRYLAAAMSGALAGLCGAYLALAQHSFSGHVAA